MIKKISRIINSIIFSFEYLNNPFIFLYIPLKKEIEIILKNNERIRIKRNHFPLYIELFQKGYNYEKKYFIKKNIKYKMTDPFILLEDFSKSYGIRDLENKNMYMISSENDNKIINTLRSDDSKYILSEDQILEYIKKMLDNV